MAQHAVELILTRQLASCLSVPIVLFGPTGDVLFYNEPAEALLGMRFQETGPLTLVESDRRVRLTDERSDLYGIPVFPHRVGQAGNEQVDVVWPAFRQTGEAGGIERGSHGRIF